MLFVCLGNICRSPMAEGLFIHKVHKHGLESRFLIDSCGIGSWHEGQRADTRTIQIAAKYGIHIPSIARQIRKEDFVRFDYILCMDGSNYNDLVKLARVHKQSASHIYKIRFFDDLGKDMDVPDPYYGGIDGFEEIYATLNASCDNLLDYVITKHGLK